MRRSRRNLPELMFILSHPARNAGQNSIAAVDAMQIITFITENIHKVHEMSCKIQRKRLESAILIKVCEMLEKAGTQE